MRKRRLSPRKAYKTNGRRCKLGGREDGSRELGEKRCPLTEERRYVFRSDPDEQRTGEPVKKGELRNESGVAERAESDHRFSSSVQWRLFTGKRESRRRRESRWWRFAEGRPGRDGRTDSFGGGTEELFPLVLVVASSRIFCGSGRREQSRRRCANA